MQNAKCKMQKKQFHQPKGNDRENQRGNNQPKKKKIKQELTKYGRVL